MTNAASLSEEPAYINRRLLSSRAGHVRTEIVVLEITVVLPTLPAPENGTIGKLSAAHWLWAPESHWAMVCEGAVRTFVPRSTFRRQQVVGMDNSVPNILMVLFGQATNAVTPESNLADDKFLSGILGYVLDPGPHIADPDPIAG